MGFEIVGTFDTSRDYEKDWKALEDRTYGVIGCEEERDIFGS